jgi:predicted outer membrane repeat protein
MTHMQLKLPTVAARTAAAGVAAVLCLGGAQTALAAPRPGAITVPCNSAALPTAISDAVSGATLSLTSGCIYVLTAGLPAITDTLTIDGRGATVERSYASGTKDFSIFTVDAMGGDLNLNNVNVRHGGGDTDNYGGAINSSGAVAIDGGTFRNSDGGEYGGAIYNDGSLTVRNAAFLDNAGDWAGAIYSYGDLAITGTSFTGNTGSDGYGGAIYTEAVNAQIADSKFTDNSTDYEGGAIGNDYNLTLTGSTFTGNEAEYGGGVYTDDDITISGDTFTGNGAAFGGGLYNDSDTTVDNSTFTHNASYYGGGIYNYSGRLEIQHDLIALNTATNEGGGIYNEAALTTDSTFTVKDNSAGVGGGGIYNNGKGTVNLFYAQVSGNNPDNCEPVNTIGGCDN